jgi:hypothetical protein
VIDNHHHIAHIATVTGIAGDNLHPFIPDRLRVLLEDCAIAADEYILATILALDTLNTVLCGCCA